MNVPFWNLLSPRKRKIIRWFSVLLALYAIVGFLVLPPIVRRVAQKQISAQLNRTATIESVKINPFALTATVRGLLIKDNDGEPFVSLDEVYVNFQLSSFLGKASLSLISRPRTVAVSANGFIFTDSIVAARLSCAEICFCATRRTIGGSTKKPTMAYSASRTENQRMILRLRGDSKFQNGTFIF